MQNTYTITVSVAGRVVFSRRGVPVSALSGVCQELARDYRGARITCQS